MPSVGTCGSNGRPVVGDEPISRAVRAGCSLAAPFRQRSKSGAALQAATSRGSNVDRQHRWSRCRFLGIFDISVGCPLAISADARANAQDVGESVCGPITTKRLERLARVYLALNADDAFLPPPASRCQRSIRPGSFGFKARASGSDCFRESRSWRRRVRAARCSWISSTRSCAIVRPQGTHRQGARRTAAYPRPKGVARIPGLDED